jgi:hypothetical protein
MIGVAPEEEMSGPITLVLPSFGFRHTFSLEHSVRIYEDVRQGRAASVREYFEQILIRELSRPVEQSSS